MTISCANPHSDLLLSDDPPILLCAFPNDALCGLVGIVKQHKSRTPFPANRAYDAHGLAEDADFKAHAKAIADEVIWWGSTFVLPPLPSRFRVTQAVWQTYWSAFFPSCPS